MTDLSRDAEYVRAQLFNRLPDAEGAPLSVLDERDLTIVSDSRFFGAIQERVREGFEKREVSQPSLPGMALTPEVIDAKAVRAVAAVRTGKGVMYLERVMTATYAEDTCRALFRLSSTETFIPIDHDDTPDSLYLRTGDYIENMFSAAALARIPASKYTRDRGIAELTTRFGDRDPQTVMDLATLTGRNNGRLRTMWLGQLVTTTKGYKFMPKAAKAAFTEYAATRPIEFMHRPDLLQIIANSSRVKKPQTSVA